MYYSVVPAPLGDEVTKFIYAALEDKADWPMNIFHNASYGIFRFGEGKLELLSNGTNMPKFRKCKCDSLGVAEVIIHNWLTK